MDPGAPPLPSVIPVLLDQDRPTSPRRPGRQSFVQVGLLVAWALRWVSWVLDRVAPARLREAGLGRRDNCLANLDSGLRGRSITGGIIRKIQHHDSLGGFLPLYHKSQNTMHNIHTNTP